MDRGSPPLLSDGPLLAWLLGQEGLTGNTIMSSSLEQLVQRLIEEESFRAGFFANPNRAVAAAGLGATPSDIAAALSIPQAFFGEFARALPSRVTEECLPAWRSVRLLQRH
jgi:hypothetical protein